MDTSVIFRFLHEISAHNNREWFADHKAMYEQARGEFEILLAEIIARLSLFDESVRGVQPAECTYRIYRDTRFSPDKTPYKTHLGGFINAHGKKSNHCGYYVHLQPSGSMLAAGAYWLPSPILKAVRQSIVDNLDEYRSIVEDKAFRGYFPSVGDDFLKTMPVGFPRDFAYPDYLKCRMYSCFAPLPDDFFARSDSLDYVAGAFAQAKRYNDFLNYTIDDFE
ncbi:MAG: DUF2461 domain-containing protein [Prevotellaceae bacterium]|nr:DUF2461 domain-containing protein [Prevotellaceae bacterium]